MTDDTIESHLSDRAIEYAEDHIGKDIQMGAVVVPPVPRDKVSEYTEDDFDNPIRGHLYDLTDIALAINHSGDPTLDHSVEDDEEPYDITDESVAELKIARGALFSAFNRELRACAERLDIDPDEHEDLVRAIRDAVGYEVETEVDEDWSTADEDDLENLFDDE